MMGYVPGPDKHTKNEKRYLDLLAKQGKGTLNSVDAAWMKEFEEKRARQEKQKKVGHIEAKLDRLNEYHCVGPDAKLKQFWLYFVTLAMRGSFVQQLRRSVGDLKFLKLTYCRGMMQVNEAECKRDPKAFPKFVPLYKKFILGLHELMVDYPDVLRDMSDMRHMLNHFQVPLKDMAAIPADTLFEWVREARKLSCGILVPAFGIKEQTDEFFHLPKLNYGDSVYRHFEWSPILGKTKCAVQWKPLPEQKELYEKLLPAFHCLRAWRDVATVKRAQAKRMRALELARLAKPALAALRRVADAGAAADWANELMATLA